MVYTLALDGGGLKGVYSLHILQACESTFGMSLTCDFDIYAGTSIGGAISACAASGIALERLSQIMSSALRPATFYPIRKALNMLPTVEYGIYARRFFSIISDELSSRRFGEISSRVHLPVYDFEKRRNAFFGAGSDINIDDALISDVIIAICSDSRAMKPYLLQPIGRRFCDGGVFAYDPSMSFLRSVKLEPAGQINLLSIGCGIIENMAHAPSIGEPFDSMFDSYLREQFFVSEQFFDLAKKSHCLSYYRISEFPRICGAVTTDDLNRLALMRSKLIEPEQIRRFLRSTHNRTDLRLAEPRASIRVSDRDESDSLLSAAG